MGRQLGAATLSSPDRLMQPIRTTATLLLIASLGIAQDSRPERPASLPSSWAELAKLIAKSPAGPQAAATWKPEVEAFAKRMLGKDDALSARLWLLQQTWWEREAGTMNAHAKELAEAILADFPRSAELARLAEFSYVFDPADREALLGKLIESGIPSAEAAALHALGTRDLRSKDKAVKERAQQRLATLATKHKDLPYKHTTYGAIADAALHAHAPAELAVGKPMPEIVGTDVDGKPLKLSDHRGKVVVIDFWGFW